MFYSHGEHKVDFHDNILTVSAKGPFNSQQILIYQGKIESILQAVSAPWAQLNILHQDCLFTPEGEKDLCASLKIRKDRGICAIAVVFVEDSYTAIVEEQLGRMYAMHDIPYGIFDETVEAELWLREQLKIATKK